MPFDPDEVARLSPEARVEVQDFYARKFLAARKIHEPERRQPRRPGEAPSATQSETPPEARPAWPRVWFRNDSSRPTSLLNQLDIPVRSRGNVRIVIRNLPK